MAGSRRDLFKRDNEKLQVYNPYEQGAQRAGDMQPLYNQKKGLPDENYHSPSMKGDRIMDAAVTTAGIAMPAGRMEEGIAAVVGRMIPVIQKAGPKVAARFANLLTKAKGNPEALTKIATRFEDDMGGMMLRPSQLQKSNPNYLDNINAVSDFKSRPVGELKGKTKTDAWLESKPAYERKAMGKPQAPKDMEDVFFEGLYKPTKKERLAADLDPNILASNKERYAERVENQLSPNELNALQKAQHRGIELEGTDKAAGPLPSNIKKIIDNIFKRFPNYNPDF